MGESNQKTHTSCHTINKSWGHSRVTIVDDTVLHI